VCNITEFFLACAHYFPGAPPSETKRLACHKFSYRSNRDEAIDVAIHGIYERWEQSMSQSGLPMRVPLLATFSGPGGGKSFFCDEVLACHEADVDRFIESRPYLGNQAVSFRQALRHKLGLAITFNDTMPLQIGNHLEATHHRTVSIRLLYSYVSC
jgi:hypothetical protein